MMKLEKISADRFELVAGNVVLVELNYFEPLIPCLSKWKEQWYVKSTFKSKNGRSFGRGCATLSEAMDVAFLMANNLFYSMEKPIDK